MKTEKTNRPRATTFDAVGRAVRGCKGALLSVALVSGVLNLLALSGSFYMMEVYDRVLPSRSVPTLIGLTILIVGLYAFQGILDAIRSRIVARIAAVVDHATSGPVFQQFSRVGPLPATAGDGLQPIRDLDQIRSFLSGPGAVAFFDLPWIPIYIVICFVFHPWIGWATIIGSGILIAVAIVGEVLSRAPAREAYQTATARLAIAETSRRNAEPMLAMGIGPRLARRWEAANAAYLETQRRATDVTANLAALSKGLRYLFQSAVLGLGAYLVIHQDATAGIIIASSIITARALAPVETAIANWRGFLAARGAWERLQGLLSAAPVQDPPLKLPAPTQSVTVEGLTGGPPGAERLTIVDANVTLRAGQVLGIIGPSASGKSSLARLMIGIWTPVRGRVRLDGATLDRWDPEDLGTHIGYLPQSVGLFDGTIAENIARFDPDMKPEAVLAAAEAAKVHDMILRLPDGYETRIGGQAGGAGLSAGQQQRIALARALYGNPFLVVLDEPNSNLDADGDRALAEALAGVRARGGIAVVIAHRPNVLGMADTVMIVNEGQIQSIGPRDEILAQVLKPPAVAPKAPPQRQAGPAPVGPQAGVPGADRARLELKEATS